MSGVRRVQAGNRRTPRDVGDAATGIPGLVDVPLAVGGDDPGTGRMAHPRRIPRVLTTSTVHLTEPAH